MESHYGSKLILETTAIKYDCLKTDGPQESALWECLVQQYVMVGQVTSLSFFFFFVSCVYYGIYVCVHVCVCVYIHTTSAYSGQHTEFTDQLSGVSFLLPGCGIDHQV